MALLLKVDRPGMWSGGKRLLVGARQTAPSRGGAGAVPRVRRYYRIAGNS